MEIKKLKNRPDIDQYKKLNASYNQLNKFLIELRSRELPDKTANLINREIDQLNQVSGLEKELRKQIKQTQSLMIKLIEREHKLVTKNHYRNTWLIIGMAAFGIPLGAAFGTGLGNMAFLGIGLTFGMVIGIAVGTRMDKIALQEGRQIDFEIKH
ncbi:MAG: hypothetical protein ACFHWX_09975 [Bacteroidota bacterium]